MKLKKGYIMKELAGRYVVLPVGGEPEGLWECLSEERTKQELIDLFLEKYDASREDAEADVNTFIENLSKAGILEV